MPKSLFYKNSNPREDILNQKITTKNSYLRLPNNLKDPVFVNETHISLVHCRDINTQTFLRLEIKFSPLLNLVATNFS